MSTQERPEDKKSKEKDDSIDDWLDTFGETKKETPVSKAKRTSEPVTSATERGEIEEETIVSDVEKLLAEFTRKLPSWVGKPWMYVKPTHDGHFKNWIESWKKLILDYTETLTVHIITIYDLQDIHPFTNKKINKDLSIPELQAIITQMVNENLAKWLDNDNNSARIDFKSDEQWAFELYEFMLEYGYATDILTLYEMKKLGQSWSSLPDSELAIILDLLIQQDKAQWIGPDRDTIQFKI